MKFKMAPNSLFAILLRSRWWISFAIAAFVTGLAAVLLPKDIAPFAAVAALPFFGVGCLAAWRQLRAPSPSQVQDAIAIAGEQSWRDFSARLERAWSAEGYAVQRLTGKAGADFQLERAGQISVVAARRWKAAVHGIEPLRELQAAAETAGASTMVYVALQAPGENANAWARQQGMVILGGADLAALLRKAVQ